MEIEIRRATSVDRDKVLIIHQELKRPARETFAVEEYLIASSGGVSIGCAGTSKHADGAYFYGLAVRKAWQRQGVGSALMQARLDAIRGTQVEYAIALMMFWNSRFFRKHGFEPIKRHLLPPSASVYPDITAPSLRRSAVVIRSVSDPNTWAMYRNDERSQR